MNPKKSIKKDKKHRFIKKGVLLQSCSSGFTVKKSHLCDFDDDLDIFEELTGRRPQN